MTRTLPSDLEDETRAHQEEVNTGKIAVPAAHPPHERQVAGNKSAAGGSRVFGLPARLVEPKAWDSGSMLMRPNASRASKQVGRPTCLYLLDGSGGDSVAVEVVVSSPGSWVGICSTVLIVDMFCVDVR